MNGDVTKHQTSQFILQKGINTTPIKECEMKEKLYLVFGVAVALSLVIGTALLTWGKSMDWAANGLTAKATMFTAEAPRLASMGEMWKGVAIFSQSVPSV